MAFLGMRGTGDWADNVVPEDWAQYIMFEEPNGSAPLYAMQSMFRKEAVKSYKYHWWSETLPTESGAVTSIYIDAGLGTAYVYATHQATHGIAGATVYVKVALALAKEFVPGSGCILIDSDQFDMLVHGHVKDVKLNGASSYLAVELSEIDDNHATSASYNLATVDRIIGAGSGYPEGSLTPKPRTYDESEFDNVTEIFRNTFDQTGTAQATEIRTGDPFMNDKNRCMISHSIGIEKSGFFGVKRVTTGYNGKPLRFSQGYINWVREFASANYANFQTSTDAAYSGKTWLQAGKKFINTYFAQLFRYLKGEAVAFVGDGALLGILELAEAYGDIQMTTNQKDYGVMVTEWHLPFGTVYFKTHPLFSHETAFQNLMVLLSPRNIRFCPLINNKKNRDTKFDPKMEMPGTDGQIAGYHTEAGWKFYFPNQGMVLQGIGKDNSN